MVAVLTEVIERGAEGHTAYEATLLRGIEPTLKEMNTDLRHCEPTWSPARL